MENTVCNGEETDEEVNIMFLKKSIKGQILTGMIVIDEILNINRYGIGCINVTTDETF